jgi:hypothetical protein
MVSRSVAVYAESGFEYCILRHIERHGTITVEQSGSSASSPLTAAQLAMGSGKDINLDFSGYFVRIGIKAGLGD